MVVRRLRLQALQSCTSCWKMLYRASVALSANDRPGGCLVPTAATSRPRLHLSPTASSCESILANKNGRKPLELLQHLRCLRARQNPQVTCAASSCGRVDHNGMYHALIAMPHSRAGQRAAVASAACVGYSKALHLTDDICEGS